MSAAKIQWNYGNCLPFPHQYLFILKVAAERCKSCTGTHQNYLFVEHCIIKRRLLNLDPQLFWLFCEEFGAKTLLLQTIYNLYGLWCCWRWGYRKQSGSNRIRQAYKRLKSHLNLVVVNELHQVVHCGSQSTKLFSCLHGWVFLKVFGISGWQFAKIP